MHNIQLVLSVLVICCFTLSSPAQDAPVDEASTSENDTTNQRGLSFNGYPYAYYTPETQLAFGAGGIFIFYTAADSILLPSKIGFGGFYSTNNQYKVSINPAIYFIRNNLYLQLPVSFGHFVDKFWGIGNDTPETGKENYTLDLFSASFVIQAPPILFAADRSGINFIYENAEIVDKMENVLLSGDEVPGSNGGKLFGIGYDLTWETRNNIFFPTSGGYQYIRLVVYPDFSNFVFYTLELDTRHYGSFSPNHVLAGQFYIAATAGETPFYKLPALGGQQKMRGYFKGRYRDKIYTTFQLEYRQYFWWRLGFVVFGGVGEVAPDLLSFRFRELKPSYGAGLRFLFNKEQRVNLRVDLGFGEDGNRGIYFGIEEAF
jgi:outer membrane protein assembly factor BamA